VKTAEESNAKRIRKSIMAYLEREKSLMLEVQAKATGSSAPIAISRAVPRVQAPCCQRKCPSYIKMSVTVLTRWFSTMSHLPSCNRRLKAN
jgi:hypothetical protein